MEPQGRYRVRLAALRSRLGRGHVSDAAELSGFGCLVGAAFWWQPIVGLVALGAVLVLAGMVIDQ